MPFQTTMHVKYYYHYNPVLILLSREGIIPTLRQQPFSNAKAPLPLHISRYSERVRLQLAMNRPPL